MVIVHIPLNRYIVEMANPASGCVRGFYDELMHNDLGFKHCIKCPFLASDKNTCMFEVVSVETAHGDGYIQFICISCGETVQKRGSYYYSRSNSDDKNLKCKHCNRLYSYIDGERNDDIARFATRVVNNQQEFVEE